jgi:hypothetical protein
VLCGWWQCTRGRTGALISTTVLLVAAPSLEGGGGRGEQTGGQRGPRGQTRMSLVLRDSERLGANGLSGAGHKWR